MPAYLQPEEHPTEKEPKPKYRLHRIEAILPMSTVPAVLLLDDGELNSVADLLDRSGIEYRRVRGAEMEDEIPPPYNLLVATPRHASKVRRGSPPGSLPGRPVRIIATNEDSPSMRRMLRQMGFNLLIRQPTHPEVWRLLLQRALYQGDERRRDIRLPMGSEVELAEAETGDGAVRSTRSSLLVDISNRGCHLAGEEPFEVGTRLSFELSSPTIGPDTLELSGEVVRAATVEGSDGERQSCAMVFDQDLDEKTRMNLARLINSCVTGPASLAPATPNDLALPNCDSPALPGLCLDDETDPPVSTEMEVELQLELFATVSPDETERRKNRRADYAQRIEAEGSGGATVLMGRDLSSGGMRVERFSNVQVGAHIHLALYGPSEAEPTIVDAEVIRDDGIDGIALRFCNLSRSDSEALESFVACLPAVESLEAGEADGMGAIITEVLPSD